MEAKATLLIVGVAHEWQREDPHAYLSGFESNSFYKQLLDIVDAHSVSYLGEEVDDTWDTVVQRIAKERGCKYRNVDISTSLRKNIHHRPPKVPNAEGTGWEDLLKTDQYAKAWNPVREYHIYRSFLEGMQRATQCSFADRCTFSRSRT